MDKLILNQVTVGYPKVPLIRDIHIQLGRGQLIALLGENGTGKSTLMRSLLKLHPIIAGEISYQNQKIEDYSQKEWASVFAAVFSRSKNIPHIKVKELIQIGSSNNSSNQIDKISKLLEIDKLLNQFSTQISDGQLQKVMIARAILQDTPFIIFDEPTAHLDYKNKRKVFELLKKTVVQTQKTFIVITHEILHALAICDECWMIHNQQLYVGSPQEIDSKFNLKKQVLQNTIYGS